MYEIDKAAFGQFVARERRRLGMTQKQLAARVTVSDKAVSKWETGASLPDIQLLTPLAGALGVTVAELLACRRMPDAENETSPAQLDALVGRALYYHAQPSARPDRAARRRWGGYYALAAAVCIGGTVLLVQSGRLPDVFWGAHFTMMLLGLLFGGYFCLFCPQRLPAYYDENRIDCFTDGPIRLHMTGIALNNRCWPKIVAVCRLWSLALLAGAPVLQLVYSLLPKSWAHWAALACTLGVTLGGLFVPVYRAARAAESNL